MPRYFLPRINKYVTFAASLLVAFSGGLGYLFGVWSPALKDAYGLNQGQIEMIAAAGNIGGYSSFISGLMYDALEHHHHVGPRLSLVIGSSTSFIGFIGLWAAITKRFTAKIWQLAVLTAIAGNGGTFFDTTCLATNLRNFPAQRGPVVGIIKAGVGLSASLYTSVFVNLFEPHQIDKFLFFLAFAPTLSGLLSLPLFNYVSYVQKSELEGGYRVFSPDGRFILALQTVGTLALYLMATALAIAFGVTSRDARIVMALGTVLLLCPIALIPLGSGGLFAKKAENTLIRVPTDVHEIYCRSDAEEELEEEEEERENLLEAPLLQSSSAPPLPMPSFSLTQCFSHLNFWLLAVICGIGVGCGLSFLNNIAQLVVALSGPTEARSVVISLFGVASCAGRLLFGAVPEKFLHAYGVPRPVFLCLAAFSMSATCAGLAFCEHLPLLYALAGSAGLSFGAHWSLLPSLSSEMFGLTSFASIYTFLQMAPAATAYALGVGLVGALYQAAAARHGDAEGTSCIGVDCFQAAFLIMSGLAGVAGVLSVWLVQRTLSLYRVEAAALRSFDDGEEE